MPSRLNYRSYVPDGSFIAEYMDAQQDSETASAYDFWCACWLLSVGIGRTIRIERPRAPIYMNLYCILTAESGVTRKGTAVKLATEVARLFMEQHAMGMRLIQNATTPARLLVAMNELTARFDTTELVISIEELVTVLGRNNWQMPGFLTDLYDCPAHRIGGTYATGPSIKDRITINIRNVFISLLGASTPSWLIDSITPAIIEGGFTSRCLFIAAEDRKRRIAWPDGDRSFNASYFVTRLGAIRERAGVIQQHLGGIPVSEGAKEEFAAWYSKRDEHRDPFRASFEAREDHHVLRLAGFLCVSDGLWEIQYHHVNRAIKIIRTIKEDASGIFTPHVPIGRTVAGVEAVCQRLIGAGRAGLSQSQLGGMVGRYMTREHMTLCLNIMHEHDIVQKFEVKDSKYGKALTLWRATKRLRLRGAQALVLREFERVLTEASVGASRP
jgi:hypothetical protein